MLSLNFSRRPFLTHLTCLAAGLLVVIATPARADHKLPSQVNLIPDFQKLGLSARVQGDRDTCSVFAVTGVAEFEHARQKTPPKNKRLSEEFLIWAGNQSSGLKGDQAMFYKAVHGLNTLGICSADEMPYAAKTNAARKPTDKAVADARTLSGRWQVEWIRAGTSSDRSTTNN